MTSIERRIVAGPFGPAFFCRTLAPVAAGISLLCLILAGGASTAGAAAGSPPGLPLRADAAVDFLCREGAIAASIVVEIAQTPSAWERGLMGRDRLELTEGMLFVWDRAEVRRFWMRNTPLSLDMMFLNDEGRILNVAEWTKPMSDRVYVSRGPARYVIEVRGGFADRFGIDESCRIRWRRF